MNRTSIQRIRCITKEEQWTCVCPTKTELKSVFLDDWLLMLVLTGFSTRVEHTYTLPSAKVNTVNLIQKIKLMILGCQHFHLFLAI